VGFKLKIKNVKVFKVVMIKIVNIAMRQIQKYAITAIKDIF